jgi:UDP-glucose 4-epimerase
MRILVTGACGLVGSFITSRLILAGHEVNTLDIKPSIFPEINHIQDDLNGVDLERIFNTLKPEAVIHLAAQVSVVDSIKDPYVDAKTNILATIALAQAALSTGIQTFVYANSGGAIYDSKVSPPYSERSALNPLSPYGVSKLSSEKYLSVMFANTQIKFISLRLANVYGVSLNLRSVPEGIITRWLNAAIQGETLKVRNWESRRDFVHANDVASAFEKSLTYIKSGVFNIGSGVPFSLRELFDLIENCMGKQLNYEKIPEVMGEIETSYLDNSLAIKSLDWSPKISLDEGIRITMQTLMEKLK